jgi:hypothetical protein
MQCHELMREGERKKEIERLARTGAVFFLEGELKYHMLISAWMLKRSLFHDLVGQLH